MATPTELLVALGEKRGDQVPLITGLLGAANARDLKDVQVTDGVFDALVAGLGHQDSRVRWWSVQLLDHVPDSRAIAAIAPLLRDPVPRVRRNAAHALGCVLCKPGWNGELPDGALDELVRMADDDENAKIRRQARQSLTCHRPA
jgi:hypothetical protein